MACDKCGGGYTAGIGNYIECDCPPATSAGYISDDIKAAMTALQNAIPGNNYHKSSVAHLVYAAAHSEAARSALKKIANMVIEPGYAYEQALRMREIAREVLR